jgi:hypothetical protein
MAFSPAFIFCLFVARSYVLKTANAIARCPARRNADMRQSCLLSLVPNALTCMVRDGHIE